MANDVEPENQRDAAAASFRNAVADAPDVLELVADVCRAPMAALKIAGRRGARFAATWGFAHPTDVPTAGSLCDLVTTTDDLMVVDDATHDPRLAGHPLVLGATQVTFVAAAPLHHEGHIVGALCVFDNHQRQLDGDTTRRYLGPLARRVEIETDLRHRILTSAAFPWDHADGDIVVRTVSHEIRTPLTVIHGYTEMLADTPALATPYATQLQAIIRNTDRLCRAVDTLLSAVQQRHHEPS